MSDRPIIFSEPMVRALLAGRKTQTRRIFVPPAPFAPGDDIAVELATGSIKPRWQAGDRLWVREAFSGPHEYDVEKWLPGAWFTHDPIWYWADGNPTDGDWTRPKPSIHMPRWASRLTLLVTDVKVERLQDISEADILAEGVHPFLSQLVSYRAGWDGSGNQLYSEEVRTRRPEFARLWNSLHGPDAWATNPFVAAISFDVIRANIDSPLPAPSARETEEVGG